MPIRVLQICASLNECGGVQTVIQNYYAHMDQKAFVFDFIVMNSEMGGLESWFVERGSHIYHVTPRSVSFRKNTQEIKQIIKNTPYDVVHCHQDYKALISMMIAKFYGVKKRIVHSHLAFPEESIGRRMIRKVSMCLMKSTANEFIGCGRDAARWLYGDAMLRRGDAIVLNNAVDIAKYAFSDTKRNALRKAMKIENKLVLGNISRFTYQKNHKLLLDIFSEFYSRNPESVLLLAGEGDLKEETEAYCNELGLSEAVLFLGSRSDVPDLLSAMDAFVLPSRFEGLALIMIEAQANGVPAVCSPNVTQELGIQSNVLYVPEGSYETTNDWCKTIEKALGIGRLQDTTALTKAGFNIREEAKKLERIYDGKINTP